MVTHRTKTNAPPMVTWASSDSESVRRSKYPNYASMAISAYHPPPSVTTILRRNSSSLLAAAGWGLGSRQWACVGNELYRAFNGPTVRPVDFRTVFKALTDHDPYPWQERLGSSFLGEEYPEQVDLPTGSGKTSIMAIWLAALTIRAQGGRTVGSMPRRLVWVVDRRVVVDQASREATHIATKLNTTEPIPETAELGPLASVRRALLGLSVTRSPTELLAVSSLRGELAEDPTWKQDPARPSIVVGTVDMVGSRLLFSGYGDGLWQRPYHAGLLGQDSLLVLDEAHLSPAFAVLTESIARLQRSHGGHPRPMRVMHLSATLRSRGRAAFTLDSTDESDAALSRRLRGRKSLFLHPRPREEIATFLAERAVGLSEHGTVVVYVRSPECAGEVAERLRRLGARHLRVVTGTLRGYERDGLVSTDPVLRRFLTPEPRGEGPAEPAYLVATSAAEVGIDLDADHMVSDLTSIEGMLQRLGRVNRRGVGNARVEVVEFATALPTREDRLPSWFAQTWRYLESLPRNADGSVDASVSALRANPPPLEAFSATPAAPPLTRDMLDSWSLTSIEKSEWPGRPAPHLWLHGAVESEPPETALAWRVDVSQLASPDLPLEDVEEVIRSFPVAASEKARDAHWRVARFIRALAERSPATGVLVAGASGELWRGTLEALAEAGRAILENATVLLPVGVGGLRDGFIDDSSSVAVHDVAEEIPAARRRRFLLEPDGGGWKATGLIGEDVPLRWPDLTTRGDAVSALEEATGLEVVSSADLVVPRGDEETAPQGACLAYLIGSSRVSDVTAGSFAAPEDMGLELHLERVARWSRRLAEALELAPDLAEALEGAGRWHDRGKLRDSWQAAIGNPDPAHPLAKTSHGRFDRRITQGYRHELGSLLDVSGSLAQGPAVGDLARHLIGAHHGYGRPSFPPRAFDRSHPAHENRAQAGESIRRFDRLTLTWGWYGLAYLEAILKSADALGSRGA